MSLIEVLKVLVFGIIEGFTEWLPISNEGHIILIDEIIRLEASPDFAEIFLSVIPLGAILAIMVLYFPKLNPFAAGKKPVQKRATIRLWLKILIACLPALIVRLLIEDWIDVHLMKFWIIAPVLILYGILFLVLEQQNGYKEFPIQKTGQVTGQMALYIGLFQLLALVPGTSRTGAVILIAMVLGCSRTVAAELSFYLGIPTILITVIRELVRYGFIFTPAEIGYLLIGIAAAFAVSVYTIRFLMAYLKNNDFRFFGWYRIVLGGIVLVFFIVQGIAAWAAR